MKALTKDRSGRKLNKPSSKSLIRMFQLSLLFPPKKFKLTGIKEPCWRWAVKH